MKIKLFENFDQIDLDVTYEMYKIDKNGDEVDLEIGGYVNPFDLKEVYDLYLKHKNKNKNNTLFIKKVTKETLDEKEIEILLQSKKYNI